MGKISITVELTEAELTDIACHFSDSPGLEREKTFGADPKVLFSDGRCQSVFEKVQRAILEKCPRTVYNV